jgi:RimJ/RimL family protein N-acetyltransferase
MVNKMTRDFPTTFESSRLRLRRYQPGDGKWYYAMSLKNSQHLMQFEADNVAANVASEEAAETLVCELAKAWDNGSCFFIGAFEKTTGEFVAQIYVGPIDWNLPEFQIGYFAEVDHEGRGYVTEGVRATLKVLFNQLQAHRVRLACDETNLRSIRVAERCGMTREGCLRENRRNPDGIYHGSYIYGLLADEYQAN